MIFSTYRFIFYFLPITFFVYYLFNRFRYYSLSKIWLVICSLYFYSQGSPAFFPFFLGSITGNYLFGMAMVKTEGTKTLQKKLLFAAGLGGNIALLGYYKYTDFFIENYNLLTKSDVALRHIVLPIGISFFTFQLIAFLVDCYRGETQEYDFINYLLFITFFPQLIVGPIIHHAEIVPQFQDERNLRLNYDNIALGLFMFSIGCAKKILLADPLTTDAQSFFNAIPKNPDMIHTWFASIEYTISYYFDLSGYADMAIGLGLLFNMRIPHNFDSPYKARNFQDYWRRWHMTLSRFLSAYIFRSVYKKEVPWRNYYIATMVTFLVSGFWHGAGWTFVLWGIINGFLVCIASAMKRRNLKLPFLPAFLLTALGVVLMRILFVADSFADVRTVYASLVNFRSLGSNLREIAANIFYFVRYHKGIGLRLTIALVICWFLPNSQKLQREFRPNVVRLLYSAILMLLCLVNMNRVVQFLYFQF